MVSLLVWVLSVEVAHPMLDVSTLPILSASTLCFAAFLLGRYALLRTTGHAARGLMLQDGRVLATDRPVRLALVLGLPFASAVWILLCVGVGGTLQGDLIGPLWMLTWAGAMLLIVLARRRWSVVRLIRAVHGGSPEAIERAAAKAHPTAEAWVVLGHYVRGEPAAARAAGQHSLWVPDEVAQLLRWDAAARGDLSLDDLRELPRRGDLGSRFCWEVALRLAALREGRCHDVPHAAAEELHLPNRIGDALRVLENEIQRALASPAGAAPLPEPAEGAWIRGCWPQLFASSHP